MTNDNVEALLREFDGGTDRRPGQPPNHTPGSDSSDGPPSPLGGLRLERSFASAHLDELIIAVLLRRDEANGMEIIRAFTHLFGVQFSPGTVYPHLHSLEEEGVLACRECVQTKEYRIDDERAAREYVRSTLTQLSSLGDFFGAALCEAERE